MPVPCGRKLLQCKEARSLRAFSAGHRLTAPTPRGRPVPESADSASLSLGTGCSWSFPPVSQESCRLLPETHAAGRVASPCPWPPLHALWRPLPSCLCKVSTAKSLAASALANRLRLSGLTRLCCLWAHRGWAWALPLAPSWEQGELP